MLHDFLIDVGVVFPNNSILLLSGYVELKLGTWIPLGLHLDQSNYMGWVLKPSAHNSINVLSSKFTRNSISLASSYVRADQLIMDSFQLQCTQHGLFTVTLHITRFTNNRVMWKTNHHCGHSILVLRLMP